MVTDQKAEKILRLVKPAIRESIGSSKNIAIKVERCPSFGWSSERYVLSTSTEDRKNQKYYCKCFNIKDENDHFIRKNLENEYRGLRFAYHCFKGSSHFFSPKPIALFENEKIILMEYVKGKNLLAYTNAEVGKFGFKKISGLLSSYHQKTGEMLRLFQNIPSTCTSISSEKRIANKEIFETGMLAIGELSGVGISQSILNDYKDYIITLEQNFRIDDLLPVHWDFRPQNIIIEEKTNRLGLVDFQLYTHTGNPFRDPATFASSLIAYDMFFSRRSNLDALISNFFSGYLINGKPFINFSMDLLDLVMQVRIPWQINSLINKTSRTPYQYMKNKIICFHSEIILKNVLSSGSLLKEYYMC